MSPKPLMRLIHPIPLLIAALPTALALSNYQPVNVHSLQDRISVRMHQASRFVFDQQGDRLLNPRPVRGAQKQPTVMLQLNNEMGGGISGLNTALITSKYPNILHCRGAAQFRGKPGFVMTGEYKVNRRDPTAVTFHEPVQEFLIWDLRLADK
jgi:hypothetical protein